MQPAPSAGNASQLSHEWFCVWLVKNSVSLLWLARVQCIRMLHSDFRFVSFRFVLEELPKETKITSPYDGLKYTHSELIIFRPKGCSAQGDSSIESEGASFLSRTKLKSDQVWIRSLRPTVVAADKFFLQISLISFPSSLELVEN